MTKLLLYLFIFLVSSCSEDFIDSNVYGCMDKAACNYLPAVTKSNNSCKYSTGSVCLDNCLALDSWTIDILVSIVDETSCGYSLDDYNNTIGINKNASNGYDDGLDIVDPQGLSCISFYFEHESWGHWSGDFFTADIKESGIYSTYNDKISWNATLENKSGSKSRVKINFEPSLLDFKAFYEVVVDGYSYSFIDSVELFFLMEIDQKSSIIINVWNICQMVTE